VEGEVRQGDQGVVDSLRNLKHSRSFRECVLKWGAFLVMGVIVGPNWCPFKGKGE